MRHTPVEIQPNPIPAPASRFSLGALPLRTQLILGTVLILSLGSITAILGYLGLRKLQVANEVTLINASEIRELSLSIQNAFLRARQYEAGFLASWSTPGFDVSTNVNIAAHQSNLNQARDYLEQAENLIHASDVVSLLSIQGEMEALRPLLDQYESNFSDTVKLLQKNDRDDPYILAQSSARSSELAGEIEEMTGLISAKSKAGLDQTRLNLTRLNRNGNVVLVIFTGLVIFAGMLSATLLARIILVPINQLSQAAQRMGRGDLSTRVKLMGGAEIATLANSFNNMADRLQQTLAGLEQSVAERTQDLQRYSAQLRTAAEIAGEVVIASSRAEAVISTAENPIRPYAGLLSRAVTLIRERFGFSEVGIYMIDDTGKCLILKALAPDSDEDIDRPALWLNTDDENASSPILQAAQRAQPRHRLLVPAVSEDSLGQQALCSELAIPLKAGSANYPATEILEGMVIGVLDVLSQPGATIEQEEITIYQMIADQLAVAIQNARLFQALQDRLGELETLYGHQSREAFLRLAQKGIFGYQYDWSEVAPLEVAPPLPGTGIPGSETSAPIPLRLPIQMRGQTIGSLDVWPEGDIWTDDQTRLLNALGDRISQAIDSARLFEEVQARASREQMLNQVTASFTAGENETTTPAEDLLSPPANQPGKLVLLVQNAVRALGQLPDVSEASIQVDLTDGPYPLLHFRSAGESVEVSDSLYPEERKARQENQTVLIQPILDHEIDDPHRTDPVPPGDYTAALAIPLHLSKGGYNTPPSAGVMNLRFVSPLAPETVTTFEEIASRLSLVLENTRLLEETQRRAEREHQVAEITSRLRASNHPQEIISTAIQELRKALRASHVHIKAGPDPASRPPHEAEHDPAPVTVPQTGRQGQE